MTNSNDNMTQQMIIAEIISIISQTPSNNAASDLQPHAEAKKVIKVRISLDRKIVIKGGTNIKKTDKADVIPNVDFKYDIPLLTVRSVSPTALPTVGIKLALANLTVLEVILSVLALSTL